MVMNLRLAILTGLVLVSIGLAAEAGGKAETEAMGWGHMATLSPMKSAPVLDGKLSPGEWDDTIGTVNFLKTDGKEEPSFMGMAMDLREGRSYVGYVGDKLYIAVVSDLPPRSVYGSGKHSVEKPRDAELIGDFNALEIWLDPNRDRRESKQGDQSFYQFFVNTVGSVYDARIKPGAGVDKGWNTDVQSAHGVDNDRKIWVAEMAISLKDFGWTADGIAGKSMGILIARNYKAPWSQPTWFTHGGPFVEWFRYPRIYFTQDAPMVRIESLGDKLWQAKPDFKVRLYNPGPARSARVAMHVRSSDMPDLKNEQVISLPAKGVAFYAYKPGEASLHEDADHYFKVRVTSADTDQPWFDYAGMWTRDPRTTKGSGAGAKPVRWSEMRSLGQKWDIRAEASPQQSVGVNVWPSCNAIKVDLNAEMLVADPDGADKDRRSDSACVALTRDNKELGRVELAWDLPNRQTGASHTFTLSDLPEGNYTVSVAFNRHPDPIVKTYTRIKFPWEGTHVGVTDTIYPPFTAVKASPSNTAVVCRNYGVGDLGLWNSIKSLDREILAGPMVVRARSQESGVRSQNGERNPGEDEGTILTGKAKLVKSTPTMAVYEAEAMHPAVTVRTVCTTELDGCMKVELTLLPPGKRIQESGVRSQNSVVGSQKAEGSGQNTNREPSTIDHSPSTIPHEPSPINPSLASLILEIPLKDEFVPLWHACTTAIRVNPMGDLPKGEGAIWDSRQFPNGDWIGNFTPYLWLGGAERGLAVFGNNDRGWVLNRDAKGEFAPCQELIRNGGVLTLRLNLVQKPIDLAAEAAGQAVPRKIVLGFMASPGKPIPYKDWRGLLVHGHGLGAGFEYLARHNFSMGCAVETVFDSAYPYHRDYSIYDARLSIPGTPGGDLVREKGWNAFFEDWKRRNGLDKPPDELDDGQKYAIGRATQHPGGGVYSSMYWDEYHGDTIRHPERRVFNGEWGDNNMAASRRDFRCYYAAETVKRGIGLYFDNAYPHATRNLINSDAYLIPGIGVQPSANLWEQRDYHRRIWTIHREFGGQSGKAKPMQMIHMTNTGILPVLTWNDMNLDLEWFFGPEPQQLKYGIGLLQAETAGRQFGVIPYAIAKIENCRTPAEQWFVERTKFGAMMVHDIRIVMDGGEVNRLARILYGFGYGLSGLIENGVPGDTVYNYWDDAYPVACDQPLVKSLLVKRGEELMLLVCSWDREERRAVFTFDTHALGLTLHAARNAEGSADEQAAAVRTALDKAKALVAQTKGALDGARERYQAGKAVENQVKAAEADLKRAEADLRTAEDRAAIILKTAAYPIEFNARNARLSVGLEGMGVRLIRLK